MKENKKDQQVTGGKNDNQNQDGQLNKEKDNGKSLKPTVTGSDDNKKAIGKTELEDNEHKHDYKVPVGEQNRPNKKHDQNDNTKGNISKNKNSTQGFNTNKKESK